MLYLPYQLQVLLLAYSQLVVLPLQLVILYSQLPNLITPYIPQTNLHHVSLPYFFQLLVLPVQLFLGC